MENCKTNEEQTGLSVELSPFVHVCVLNVFGFFVLTWYSGIVILKLRKRIILSHFKGQLDGRYLFCN